MTRPRLPGLARLLVLALCSLLGSAALGARPAADNSASNPAKDSAADAAARVQRHIQLTRSIVKIEVRTAHGYALGTGVVVAPGRVVASCHVTRDAEGVDALYTGLRLHAQAQQADIGHDLCLLDVPTLEAPAVPLASSATLHLGQPLLALGFSGGLGISTSRGEVIDLYTLDGGQVIRSSTGFISGASGGGLFNDAGELVGVLTFRLRGADRHYFSVPSDWVTALLRRGNTASAITPMGGRAFWEAPMDPAGTGRPVERLATMPHFLRATVLDLEQRWADLADEAQSWLADVPDQPQARQALAKARAQLATHGGPSSEAPIVALPVATAASSAAASAPASADSNEESSSPEPSQAERLLFMQAHLAAIRPSTDLVYDVVHDDASDASQSFTDSVRIRLAAGPDGSCCAVAGEFLSGARAMRLPDIGSATSNPLLLYFLEYEVRRLERASKGQASHFRRRIRLALVDAASVREIEIDHAGRRIKAHEITVSPYTNDPFRVRFVQEATREYRFVIADELPGQIASIEVRQAGSGDKPRRVTTRITLKPAAP